MVYLFADGALDPDRHELTREGDTIHVEPQVFDILVLLAQNSGDLVSRDDLIAGVWKGLIISESTISARINAARSAVGDNGKEQRIIKTVPRRGFKMIAPVEMTTSGTAPGPVQAASTRQDVRFATSADGMKIAFARSGNGPPLVRVGHWLSHLELDWHSPVWRPLLDALGRRHSVYRYDQRGTGLSGRDFVDEGIDGFVDDLRAVADTSGLDRFPIFAASQAVPVAVKFAVESPERVSKLILYGGYAEGRALRPRLPNDVDEETVLALIRAGWGVNGSTFVKAFSALFMPDATQDQIDSFVRIQLESISPAGAARLRQIVDRFSVQELLPKVQCPTLVIHARSDVIHPLEQGQCLASEIPDARFLVLDSPNHVLLPQDKCWADMMSEIEAFLQSPHDEV